MVRVTELVAFFTIFSVADFLLFVFLPEILSLTHVPTMAAIVDVTAVVTAFSTLLMMPFLAFPPFSFSFSTSFSSFSAAAASACSSICLSSTSKALSRSIIVSYLP